MMNLCFQDITEEFRLRINKCNCTTIESLYSNFSYLYYYYKKDYKNQSNVIDEKFKSFKSFLLDYLANYKFIVYKIMNLDCNNNFSINNSIFNNTNDNSINENNKSTKQLVNIIFCIEKQCLIIESVPCLLIEQVIQKLNELKYSIINLNFNQSISATDVKTEINSFYDYFRNNIKINEFYEYTIRPIAAFMIRRYFYPTKYFKYPSFFIFNDQKSYLSEIHDFLFTEKNIEFQEFKKIKPIHGQNKIFKFQDDEFIHLRIIYGKNNIKDKLVFHLKSFHLFVLKSINIEENSREITFCENYSHRCFVPFYGFIKINDKKIGLIYEFMSNDSLDSFINTNSSIVNEAFIMMTINRISQGIDYLNKNDLFHRDLKPSNILLNHDYMAYINDYETIRNINENGVFTGDLGSALYSSPEQLSYNKCSYETDIYSFGLIIYFLFHKKHFMKQRNLPSDIKFPKTNKIQKLFYQCICFQPNLRPSINKIKNILNEEINSLYFILQLLNDCELENNQTMVTQLIYENICLIYSTNDDSNVDKYLKHIYCMRSLFLSKIRNDDLSKFFIEIGQLYENIDFLEHNYLKSKEYYKKSSELNNSDALNKIGDLYKKGLGFNRDIIKAKKYYEKSAEMNNSDALNNLGDLYYYGIEIGQDYSKSKEYYEKSAKLNNSNGFLNLGKLYENGEGVEQDYNKAREMYKKSEKLNNSDAFNCIGFLYFYGYGCEINYEKAEKNFKLANNSDGLNNIGLLYKKQSKYALALQYFEKSVIEKKDLKCRRIV